MVRLKVLLNPFRGRKAVDDTTNSGLRFTAGLAGGLILAYLMINMFITILNGAKDIKDSDAKFRQLENDSISFYHKCDVTVLSLDDLFV